MSNKLTTNLNLLPIPYLTLNTVAQGQAVMVIDAAGVVPVPTTSSIIIDQTSAIAVQNTITRTANGFGLGSKGACVNNCGTGNYVPQFFAFSNGNVIALISVGSSDPGPGFEIYNSRGEVTTTQTVLTSNSSINNHANGVYMGAALGNDKAAILWSSAVPNVVR